MYRERENYIFYSLRNETSLIFMKKEKQIDK